MAKQAKPTKADLKAEAQRLLKNARATSEGGTMRTTALGRVADVVRPGGDANAYWNQQVTRLAEATEGGDLRELGSVISQFRDYERGQ